MNLSFINSRIIKISIRTMKISTLFQSLLFIKIPGFLFCAPNQHHLYWNCTDTVDSTDDESLLTAALQEVNICKSINTFVRIKNIFGVFFISLNFSWNSEPQLSKQKMFLWPANLADSPIRAQPSRGMGVGGILEQKTSWTRRGLHFYMCLFWWWNIEWLCFNVNV